MNRTPTAKKQTYVTLASFGDGLLEKIIDEVQATPQIWNKLDQPPLNVHESHNLFRGIGEKLLKGGFKTKEGMRLLDFAVYILFRYSI